MLCSSRLNRLNGQRSPLHLFHRAHRSSNRPGFRSFTSSHATANTRSFLMRRPYLSLFFGGTTLTLLYSHLADGPNVTSTEYDGLLPHLSNSSLASTNHLRDVKLGDLARMWIVYAFSGSTIVVVCAPKVVKGMEWIRDNVPVVGQGVWDGFMWITRRTFFTHFVAGETAASTLTHLTSLSRRGVGGMLNYSSELYSGTSGLHTSNISEVHSAIHVASTFPYPSQALNPTILKPTMVSVKLTSFVNDPNVLKRATTVLVNVRNDDGDGTVHGWVKESPVWIEGDLETLEGLEKAVEEVVKDAKGRGVKVLIDAEESWFQPAIDCIFEKIAQRQNTSLSSSSYHSSSPSSPSRSTWNPVSWFSSSSTPTTLVSTSTTQLPPPTLYNTYQCYLQSTPDRLLRAISRSQTGNYSLGIKLVRGAYMSTDGSGVWTSKDETDKCWNEMAKMLVHKLREGHSSLGVVLATHNSVSTRVGVKALIDERLVVPVGRGQYRATPGIEGRLVFGQLMGMSDSLTHAITTTLLPSSSGKAIDVAGSVGEDEFKFTPFAVKCSPYAPLETCLPYLVRRANENRSILESGQDRMGAKVERRLVGREILRRLGWTWSVE